MSDRIACLPLLTFPEPVPDPAILAAVGVAAGLGCGLDVVTLAADIPRVTSPLGGMLIDVAGMARAAENRSKAACHRLQALVEGAVRPGQGLRVTSRLVPPEAACAAAAQAARQADLALLPWQDGMAPARDLTQALVFDTGVPVILVPPAAPSGPVSHLAIAWDDSPVAVRALGDGLRLLAPGGRVTVLTVTDDKALSGAGIAQVLAESLARRGHAASSRDVALEGRTIAAALQDSAAQAGAHLLAMGGFGHSRLRDFVLGGATRGVLEDLRMRVLLAH